MSKNPFDFDSLAQRWPSAVVARERVDEFSGGTLNAATMANLDAKGAGPARRIRIGRKVAYPVADLVEWLKSRSEVIE